MRDLKSAVFSRLVNFSAAMLIQSAAAGEASSKHPQSEQALDAIMDEIHRGGEAWTSAHDADFNNLSTYTKQSDNFGAILDEKFEFLLESMHVALDQKRDEESEILHRLSSSDIAPNRKGRRHR